MGEVVFGRHATGASTFLARDFRKADVDVTMVAKTTHHLFQPLLYQVATGILSEGEIAPPTAPTNKARSRQASASAPASPTAFRPRYSPLSLPAAPARAAAG